MPPSLALPRRVLAAPRLRLPHLRLVLIALVVAALLGGGWLWLRQSSLVAVRHVTVTGASGPQAARIAAALEAAARDMTTLDVRSAELRRAVEPFPIVAGVSADASPPHRLRIVVHERLPVAVLVVAGARVGVAADGTILRGTPVDRVPAVALAQPTAGPRLDDRARRAVALLAAAPPRLRARVARLELGSQGWIAPLRDGPLLVFGDAARAAAKWAAAVVVLGDRRSAGATYVDLRLPERPAAGGVLAPSLTDSPSTSG